MRVILLAGLFTTAALAQSPAFEVASVRLNQTQFDPPRSQASGPRATWTAYPFESLLMGATDWHVHDSEFRYVLQPGETISASHSMPIGQVMFVPREEITFRNGTEEEIAARHKASQEFYDEKSRTKVKTPYGLEYSPLYQRTSRRRNSGEEGGA